MERTQSKKPPKPTDLKLLVSCKLGISIDAQHEELVALSKRSPSRYFAVLDGDRAVGLVARQKEVVTREVVQAEGSGLLGKLTGKITKRESVEPVWQPSVRDLMIADVIVIEYGTEPNDMFSAVFGRSDDRLAEDIILANPDGSFFGLITSTAVMRLLHGFLGKHLKELTRQKETLAFQHSQVVKVRRDLELTNEKLEVSRDQAVAGMRMKSQFLANMSHEIRTPMNGVFGMIDLLYDTDLDEDQEQLTTTARSSAETLMRIIDDILDFSKIESGKVSVESMPFNLVQIVETSAALYAENAAEKELDLTVEFEDAPSWVVCDPHRYQQILNNLVSNAIKFTDTGSVTVYLTAVELESGPGILTEVRDTGIGITPTNIDKLFEPFTQADESHQRKYGGTGLGLSISRNLVDLMGGQMECDSEVDKGTTFSYTLPFPGHDEDGSGASSISQKTLCTTPVAASRTDYGGMKVLLVEDNIVNQEVARRLLMKLNCKIVSAENGQIALDFLKSDGFHAVFMDCQMPVLDGYDATREIRKGEAGEAVKDIFISAMTAHAMTGDREKCIGCGMDHYFAKPFGLQDFRQALELAIQKSEIGFDESGQAREVHCGG